MRRLFVFPSGIQISVFFLPINTSDMSFDYNNIFRGLMYCGVCGGRMDFSTREGRKSLGSFCCLR